MNTKTRVARTAAQGGVVGALVVIALWALSFAHVYPPTDVVAAVQAIGMPIASWLHARLDARKA